MAPNPINSQVLVTSMTPNRMKFIGLGGINVPKPYKFTWFGNIYGPKPYEFIGFGDIYGPKPYEFIRSGDIYGQEGSGRPLFKDVTSLAPNLINL